MEIKKCYETLELTPHVTLEEVRQSYKDLVNIWHPDRVPDNPRLKKKAEEKLKEINAAYGELTSFLSSKQSTRSAVQKAPSQQPIYEPSPPAAKASSGVETQKPQSELQPKSNFFSNLWTVLNKALDALIRVPAPSHDTVQNQNRADPFEASGARRQGRGMGKKRGMGRGAGRCRKR
ncbi:MAG: J domain-containing protein [Deltaproteobacteria bacterium]|nr:J domain-containing protein [Deltaproteobacteria bacterium]